MNAPAKDRLHIADVVEQGFDSVKGYVDRSFATVHERIKQLEKRLAEIEARPSMRYLGIWNGSADYPAGSVVTEGGSMWVAKARSRGVKPGSAPAIWQLAVKRGRDSKERDK